MIGNQGEFLRRPAAVLAFPAGGRARVATAADEPRGEILLFTGVRYERRLDDERPTAHDEPAHEPLQPVPPVGSAPRRRRRS